MAINYSKITIKRTTNPRGGSRFGVVLKHLPKSFRQFLIKNKNMSRWAESNQWVECALKIQRPRVKDSSALKIYWDWESNAAVDKQTLKNNYNTIDWICAVSGKPIRSKFMNFDLENFIHPEYLDVLKAPMVDSRILKSSIEFRKKCKELLLNERQEFLNMARKNAKKRLD
jgi:hypothetical protein